MGRKTETEKGKGKAVETDSGPKSKGSKRSREEASGPRKSVEKAKNPLHESLAKCKVVPTRFLDWGTIARFGVKRDMESLFDGMGINQYMHQVEFTHADETLQFIRSLGPNDQDNGIKFRIHGKIYRLSQADIREIYGFTLMHMREESLADQVGLQDMWGRLASGDYRMGKSKSSTIRNPTIKLVQRALGFAFFGRHEVGQITLDEWRLICSALRPVISRMQPPVSHVHSVDAAVLFVTNLYKAQETATKSKPQDWPLCIGGVLTPMFRHCGVELSSPIRPVPLIDLPHLYSCRFLSPQRDSIPRYPFTWAGQQMELPLPFTVRDLVTCSDPANLVFQHTPAHFMAYTMQIHQAPEAAPRRSARYDRPMSAIPQTAFEREVAEQFGLLRRWCKWQDRTISKMADHIRLLKAKISCRSDSTAGASSSTRRQGCQSPESSNPSLELSPPPSDHESDA